MGDGNTNPKKRKSKWNTSYCTMTMAQAEKRLGFRLDLLDELPVEEMLGIAASNKRMGDPETEQLRKTKEEVYRLMGRYLRIEGKPTEADSDFKETNINHLAFSILSPILDDFMVSSGRQGLRLRTEKDIVSKDGETGGTEAVVVIDRITYDDEKSILVVEAKRSSLGQALKMCLLVLKDMGDNNDDGSKVYGFVTTGKSWKMIEYDGVSFRMTEEMIALFPRMGKDKERWMASYAVVVECIYLALSLLS